jgi:hypothetical protein
VIEAQDLTGSAQNDAYIRAHTLVKGGAKPMTITAEPAPITINFHRPQGTPLGTIMNEIRTWLDREKISAVRFQADRWPRRHWV